MGTRTHLLEERHSQMEKQTHSGSYQSIVALGILKREAVPHYIVSCSQECTHCVTQVIIPNSEHYRNIAWPPWIFPTVSWNSADMQQIAADTLTLCICHSFVQWLNMPHKHHLLPTENRLMSNSKFVCRIGKYYSTETATVQALQLQTNRHTLHNLIQYVLMLCSELGTCAVHLLYHR